MRGGLGGEELTGSPRRVKQDLSIDLLSHQRNPGSGPFAHEADHFAIVGICNDCAAREVGSRGPDATGLHSHGDFVHAHPHRGAHTH